MTDLPLESRPKYTHWREIAEEVAALLLPILRETERIGYTVHDGQGMPIVSKDQASRKYTMNMANGQTAIVTWEVR